MVVISYLAGLAIVVHAALQPSSAWVAADRSRPYWLTVLITLTLFALGIVAAIAYFVGVVPGFAKSNATVSPFRKQP
jgi:hypothetical protein